MKTSFSHAFYAHAFYSLYNTLYIGDLQTICVILDCLIEFSIILINSFQ